MTIRKNKKRIDPRYFLNETTYRDEFEINEFADPMSHSNRSVDSYSRAELQKALGDIAQFEHPKYNAALPEWMPQWIEDVKRRADEEGIIIPSYEGH